MPDAVTPDSCPRQYRIQDMLSLLLKMTEEACSAQGDGVGQLEIL